MKKCYIFLLVISASCLLTGCGSGSTKGDDTNVLSKSNLRIDIIGTAPYTESPGGIELKIDYDQSVVHPAPDINQNAGKSVSLSGALAQKETYMMAYDNGDILTINLLNARGFDNGEKRVGIDFEVINGAPGVNAYRIIPGTLKLFDLNGGEMNNFEVNLAVSNQ